MNRLKFGKFQGFYRVTGDGCRIPVEFRKGVPDEVPEYILALIGNKFFLLEEAKNLLFRKSLQREIAALEKSFSDWVQAFQEDFISWKTILRLRQLKP